MCKSLKNPKTASSFFVPVYNCDSYLHYATAIVQFALYSVSAFTRFMRLSHVSHVCLSCLAESVFSLSHLLSFNISTVLKDKCLIKFPFPCHFWLLQKKQLHIQSKTREDHRLLCTHISYMKYGFRSNTTCKF